MKNRMRLALVISALAMATVTTSAYGAPIGTNPPPRFAVASAPIGTNPPPRATVNFSTVVSVVWAILGL